MSTTPPADLDGCIREIRDAIRDVEGWLTDREAQFLAMLAACPTCEGTIVEIGSFRGRSTIALAKGAALGDGAIVHTVDIEPPSKLEMNLQQAGVRERVAVHSMLSGQMLNAWHGPVRLLWHDGANDYETVAQDLKQAQPFLSDRAVVAFHDVLNTSGVRIQVFIDKVLASPRFGATGVCGSIGWAQFRTNPADAAPFVSSKQVLLRRLQRLLPFHESCVSGRAPFAQRLRYKVLRSLVPHGQADPQTWIRRVT